MMPGDLPILEQRSDAVRELIGRAQREGELALTVLSGMDLCVLGGPGHAYFDAGLARAWQRLRPREQQKITQNRTARLVEAGQLLPGPRDGSQPAGYGLSPELGVVLATRCRPSFIITTEIPGSHLYQPVMFALGDEKERLRGLVAEIPASLAGGGRSPKSTEPLRVCYAYFLFTAEKAAAVLAEWTIRPVPESAGRNAEPRRVVTRYHPQDGHASIGYRVAIHGDGAQAQVETSSDTPSVGYSLEQLRTIMLDLITGSLR